MFRIRNPLYNLRGLITEALINCNYEKSPIKTYLKGRTLWCATQLVEILPFDYEEIHIIVLKRSSETLI